MRNSILAVPLITVALALPATAMANADLAKQHNCVACHQVDKKGVGPAYKDVAAKYKGQSGAAALLAGKIAKGGAGTWGPVPMPPNDKVPEADIKALVAWILAQG